MKFIFHPHCFYFSIHPVRMLLEKLIFETVWTFVNVIFPHVWKKNDGIIGIELNFLRDEISLGKNHLLPYRGNRCRLTHCVYIARNKLCFLSEIYTSSYLTCYLEEIGMSSLVFTHIIIINGNVFMYVLWFMVLSESFHNFVLITFFCT